jgi:lysozyme family protein
MNFDQAFQKLVGFEGALSLDPKDKGNWTSGIIGQGELRGSKFGISAASYPHLDIANLTVDRAKDIYRSDFWEQSLAPCFSDPMNYQLFDMAVNSGPRNAVIMLQRVLGVTADGVAGPKTAAAIAAVNDATALAIRFLAFRLRFMTHASGWDSQGRGWANRIADNMEEVVK